MVIKKMKEAWKYVGDRDPDVWQGNSFEDCHQTESNPFQHTPPIDCSYSLTLLEKIVEGVNTQIGLTYIVAHGYGMKDAWSFDSPEELERWLAVRIDNVGAHYDCGDVVLDLSAEVMPIKGFRAPKRRAPTLPSFSSSWSSRLRKRKGDSDKNPIFKFTRTGTSYGISSDVSSVEDSSDEEEEEEKKDERNIKISEDLIIRDRKLMGFANTQLTLQVCFCFSFILFHFFLLFIVDQQTYQESNSCEGTNW